MISADKVVYNNAPVNVRLGNQLMPRATPIGDEFDQGFKKNFYQLPVEPFVDRNRTIHSANFCNTNGEVLPCYISPSLKLNNVYASNPNANTNVYQPSYGNARNQGAGLSTDGQQLLLFKKTNFLPDQTTAGISPNHFSKK